MPKIKSYSEAISLPTFEERLKYLLVYGSPSATTFGDARYLNQTFYQSKEWKAFRRDIIIRDDGCDLAVPGYYIVDDRNELDRRYVKVMLHHINPLTIDDVLNRSSRLMDPENVICVSFNTHQLIHYGTDLDITSFTGRSAGDTIPWR